MTSTELEVVKVDFPEPLSESKAKVLDERIRQASIRVADNTATLLDLLKEAEVGQIHLALRYPSWKAYVKEVVQIRPADNTERKALVSLMNGKGMTLREMAPVLGVGKSTVQRDLASQNVPDGTSEPKQEPLDVEYEEQPEPTPEVEPEPEVKPQPVSKDFKDEMAMLYNSVSSFKEILADEQFPKARKTIAKNHLNKLQEYIADLQKVVDDLMEQ